MKRRFVLLIIFIICLIPALGITVLAEENNTDFSGGDGSPENPYIVSNSIQLNNVRKYLDACFVQVNDIDMSNETVSGGICYNNGSGWIPIGGEYNNKTAEYNSFNGIYDGNGFKIIGLKIQHREVTDYTGLFGKSSGTIKNLCVENCSYFSDASYYSSNAGGIVGCNNGTVENCSVSGEIFATTSRASRLSNSYAGGIAGYNTGEINACNNTAAVSAEVYEPIGSSADKRGIAYVGGISAYNSGSVKNCCNSVDYAGTIGYNEGKINNCYNTGLSHGGSIACINTSDGIIEHCYNKGSISGVNSRIIGGLVNENSGAIIDSHNTAKINATCGGGIVGDNRSGKIKNCYNSGSIIVSTTGGAHEGCAGGIAAENGGKIISCSNKANIQLSAKAELGQFTVAYTLYAGGIAGKNYYGIIENSYNTGSIRADSYAFDESNSQNIIGGIVGDNVTYDHVQNCYNAGSIKSNVRFQKHTNNVGGAVGYNSSENSILNCYFVNDNSNKIGIGNANGIAYSKTSNEMSTNEFLYLLNSVSDQFEPWCADLSHYQNAGYPMLKYEVSEAGTYNIYFDAMDGDIDISSKEVTYLSVYGDLPVPTMEGYGFLGWYTSKSGGENITSNSIVLINSDQVLYARWAKAHYYSIFYNVNGGIEDNWAASSQYDTAIHISETVPTRKGYRFIGWAKDKDATIADYMPNDLYSENKATILYAIWKIIPYTKTKITDFGTYKLCNVTLNYIENTPTIIVATYNDGKLLGIEKRVYSKENETFTVFGDIDTVKVMVWDNTSTMMPITKAEEIPATDFKSN